MPHDVSILHSRTPEDTMRTNPRSDTSRDIVKIRTDIIHTDSTFYKSGGRCCSDYM